MKVNEKLQHLTMEQIQNLIERYYNNENIKSLIEEFDINCTPSMLVRTFPPRIMNDGEPCIHCGSKLVQPCESRSYSYSSKHSIYCPTCGHKPYDSGCRCEKCSEERRKEAERLEKEKEEQDEIKKEILKERYLLNPLKDINDLTLKERIYLVVLLRNIKTITDESGRTILLPIKTITASEDNKIQAIKMAGALVEKGIISASWKSDVDAFTGSLEDGDYADKFYTAYVRYTINVTCTKEELLDSIRLEDYDIEDFFEICREIALNECYTFLKEQMEKVSFDFNPGEKTEEVFNELLDNFSIRQVFIIIYYSISNATRYYQEGNVSRKQAANSVITRCKNYGRRALEEGWDVKNFSMKSDYEETDLGVVFFSKVLPLRYKAYTTRLSISDVSNIIFEEIENQK